MTIPVIFTLDWVFKFVCLIVVEKVAIFIDIMSREKSKVRIAQTKIYLNRIQSDGVIKKMAIRVSVSEYLK